MYPWQLLPELPDGRIMVLDNDGFAASTLDDGKSWSPGIAFSFDELNEDFFAASDESAETWLKMARASIMEMPDLTQKASNAA